MNLHTAKLNSIDEIRSIERGVLGVLIRSPECVPAVECVLPVDELEMFCDSLHPEVYAVIVRIHHSGMPIDSVTLDAELRRSDDHPEYASRGDLAFLSELTSTNCTKATVAQYAAQIAEFARKRKLQKVAEKLQRDASNGVDSSKICEDTLRQIESISANNSGNPSPSNVAAMMTEPAPPMEFLFDGIVPLNTIAGIDASGGSGKGWLTQQLLTSVCIGRTLVDAFPVNRPSKVLWLQSEEPDSVIHSRYDAIGYAYDLSGEDKSRVEKNLTLYSETAEPLNLKDGQGRTQPTPYFYWLRDEVRRLQPRLIVIDPRSHFFAGDENSNVDVGAFMNLVKGLIKEVKSGCTVWMNHHSSKARETDRSSAMGRGASAGRDAMRVVFNLTPLTDKEVSRAGIENRDLFVKLELSKSNWTPPGNRQMYFQRCRGPSGGTLLEFEFEAQAQESGAAVMQSVAEEIAGRVGENEDALTVREMCTRDSWKKARESLKANHGKTVTQDFVKQAFECAASMGLIEIREEGTKGRPKQVPYQASEGRVEKDD